MLTLTGTIRAAAQIGGGTNRKTGEIIATRSVIQVEGLDSRGLVALFTLTVPDHKPYEGKVFPLMTFSLGDVALRDLKIDVKNTVKVSADFGSNA